MYINLIMTKAGGKSEAQEPCIRIGKSAQVWIFAKCFCSFSLSPAGKFVIRLELFCFLNTSTLPLLPAVSLALLCSVWGISRIYTKSCVTCMV